MKSEQVTIRKEHRCFSCGRKFAVGTQMISWASIYEGEFCSGYTCMTCEQLHNLSGEHEFPEDFVLNWLKQGQTPEDLLEEIIKERMT